jgi:hypothetical protein
VPDVTEFELRYAMIAPLDMFSILSSTSGIARIYALREARKRRRTIPTATWEELVILAAAGLHEHQRENPDGLIAGIDSLRPRVEAGSRGGLTIGRVVDELVAWRGEWEPTEDNFAEFALQVTSRRLRQVLDDAGTTWRNVLEDAAMRRSSEYEP